jgi:Na+/H+-dicarboxylate symporter
MGVFSISGIFMQNVFKKLTTSMPVQLALVVLIVSMFGDLLPHGAARGLYTVSLVIRDGIMTFLPIAIVAFIACTLMGFKEKAILLVATLIIFEGLSNATSVMFAYVAGLVAEPFLHAFETIPNQDFQLVPFFRIGAPSGILWSTTTGVVVGAFLGILGAFSQNAQLINGMDRLRTLVSFVFAKILMSLMPVYVLGYIVFMQHSGLMDSIVHTYGWIIALVTAIIAVYLLAIIVVAGLVGKNSAMVVFRNILPTGVVAATTMSSAATMPLTIEAAEKNLKTPGLANMLIPATTNIQQVGDCIANAFLCLVILKTFGKPMPDLATWLTFMLAFTLARYATAAVLGGAIFLMIPIYQTTLGFDHDMTAMIIALNIVLDPIITASNVLCNGGLAIIFERVWLNVSGGDKALPQSTLTIEYPYTRIEAKSQSK